jgi:hypothetical protein
MNITNLSQLNNVNWYDVKLSNGKTMRQILRDESNRLAGLIRKELELYFSLWPEPEGIPRTGDTLKSIQVVEPYFYNGGLVAGIKFDEELANHKSLFGSNYDDGYTPWLLSVGWDISDKVPNRGGVSKHPGTGWIDSCVSIFNSTSKYGLQARAYMDGALYA